MKLQLHAAYNIFDLLEWLKNTVLINRSSVSGIGLWNIGPLKVLTDIKLILNDQGSNLDLFEINFGPSEVPYSPNQ